MASHCVMSASDGRRIGTKEPRKGSMPTSPTSEKRDGMSELLDSDGTYPYHGDTPRDAHVSESVFTRRAESGALE